MIYLSNFFFVNYAISAGAGTLVLIIIVTTYSPKMFSCWFLSKILSLTKPHLFSWEKCWTSINNLSLKNGWYYWIRNKLTQQKLLKKFKHWCISRFHSNCVPNPSFFYSFVCIVTKYYIIYSLFSFFFFSLLSTHSLMRLEITNSSYYCTFFDYGTF
jgi:hypothetical protein